MKCYKCGGEVKEGMNFCPYCRAKISTYDLSVEYCNYINNRGNHVEEASEMMILAYDGRDVYENHNGKHFFCGGGNDGYMIAYPAETVVLQGAQTGWGDFYDFEYDIQGLEDYRVEPMVLSRQANGNYTVISKGKVHTKEQAMALMQNMPPMQGTGYGQNTAVQSQERSEDYSVSAFVKSNEDYYENKFGGFEMSDKKVCFNLCILLFTPLWLAYRRMYLHYLIYMLVALFTPFFWVASLVYSLYGVRLYYNKYKKLVAKGDYKRFKIKSGGSVLMAFCLSALSFIIILICIA
jgi:hypothetical protein